MGHIQKLKMDRAKRAFKEEMFPTDKKRSFYVDHAGNAIGFTMERADGFILAYNADTGRYCKSLDILPEDSAVNVPPYEYKDGKRVSTEETFSRALNNIVADAERRAIQSSGRGERIIRTGSDGRE